jgi:hypothetical protein
MSSQQMSASFFGVTVNLLENVTVEVAVREREVFVCLHEAAERSSKQIQP